jgi:hypothetical protein
LDLSSKIEDSCAHTTLENPVYGKDTKSKIDGWIQNCEDLSQENIRLLCAIQKTNLNTQVEIELGGKTVKKSIAEWVWRRRKYAGSDQLVWNSLSDRGLKEGYYNPSNNSEPTKVEIVRYFDPSNRDEKIEMYREEPYRIDSTLEIVNATTDVIE